jgi:hypothetical protein
VPGARRATSRTAEGESARALQRVPVVGPDDITHAANDSGTIKASQSTSGVREGEVLELVVKKRDDERLERSGKVAEVVGKWLDVGLKALKMVGGIVALVGVLTGRLDVAGWARQVAEVVGKL